MRQACRLAAPALGAALLLAAAPAAAIRIAGSVSGIVSDATEWVGGLPSGVVDGVPISIRWSYESTAGSVPDDENGVDYVDGLDLQFEVRIAGHEWSGTGNAISIVNDTGVDAYGVVAKEGLGAAFTTLPTPTPSGLTELIFSLIDQAAPYELLASLGLPDHGSDLDLAAVTRTIGELEVNDYYSIDFTLDPESFSLPEPAPLLLALVGMAALAASRRRRASGGS